MSGIDRPFDGQSGSCYLDLDSERYPNLEGNVFPSLLVVEALGQASAALGGYHQALSNQMNRARGYLVRLNDFTFEGTARKGERIVLEMRVRRFLGKLILFHGEAWIGERRICSGEMTFFREADDRREGPEG